MLITSAVRYTQSTLPCATQDYTLKTKEMVPLEEPDLDVYRKVCGASGAAIGAMAGQVLALAAGASLGAGFAATLFPGSAWLAGVAGGALGVVGSGYVQAKTMIGRRVGAVVGGTVGQLLSPAFAAAGVTISEERAEITKNFGLGRLVRNGGHFFHSSIPTIRPQAARDFVASLQPGDIVLTKNEGSTIFNLLTYIPSGTYDFNHSLLYLGGGRAIEATTGKGVHEFDLADELTHKHHAIAVRVPLEEGQTSQVIEAARKLKGRPYDYLFKGTTDTLYCSELVAHAYRKGAPQVTFNERSFLAKAFVLPGDLLKTDGQVVAEAGEHHSFLNGLASKFS